MKKVFFINSGPGCFTLIMVCCRVAIRAMCLFLAVPWVGLWSVVTFPSHTHLLPDFWDSMSDLGTYRICTKHHVNALVDQSRGARGLNYFALSLHLHPNFMYSRSICAGKSVRFT